MIRLFRNSGWLIAAVLLLWSQRAFAQAPSGTNTFTFDNVITPVINMSGGFSTEQSIIGVGGTETPLSFGIDLTNLVNGAIKGSGFTVVTIGEGDSASFPGAAFTANGRVSGGGFNPIRVILSVRMTGDDVIVGVQTKFTITLRYNLIFNSETGTLDGTCRGSARLGPLGSSPIRSDFVSVPVPSGSDGSWGVGVNIIVLNRLSGTGAIFTSDGRPIPGKLSGSFAPGSGRSVLHFVGTNEGKGASATFILLETDEGTTVDIARGRVLGQTIRF